MSPSPVGPDPAETPVPPENRPRRRTLSVLLGTAPGLERFLLAVVPAMVVFGLGVFLFGVWVGFGLAMATLSIVVAVSRGLSR